MWKYFALLIFVNRVIAQHTHSFLKDVTNNYISRTFLNDQNQSLFFSGIYDLNNNILGSEIFILDENEIISKAVVTSFNDSIQCERVYYFWKYNGSCHYLATGKNLITKSDLILHFKSNHEFNNFTLQEMYSINFRNILNVPIPYNSNGKTGLIVCGYQGTLINRIFNITISGQKIDTSSSYIPLSNNISFVSDVIYDGLNKYYIKADNNIIIFNGEFTLLNILNHKSKSIEGDVMFSVYSSKFIHVNEEKLMIVSEVSNTNGPSYMLEEVQFQGNSIISKPIKIIIENENVDLLSKQEHGEYVYIYYSSNVLDGIPKSIKIMKLTKIGEVLDVYTVSDNNRQMVLLDFKINQYDELIGCGYYFLEDKNFYFVLSPKDNYTISTNTNDHEEIGPPLFYPNPVKDILYLKDMHQYKSGVIYDINGRYIMEIKNSNSIDVSSLYKGLYLLKFTRDGHIITTTKFLKE